MKREIVAMRRSVSVATFVVLTVLLSAAGDAHEFFSIKIVDASTGRGVPLVALRTVNDILLVTDSAGIAAFDEPGLMGQDLFFHIESHGYEYRKDGFGYRGARLKIEPGGSATLKIKRINIAERLYRVTGAGIYRDSVRVGEPTPLRSPLLNGGVFGSDSVVNAVYRGRIYWFWGDTNRASYPLGNFHASGAVSSLPDQDGLDPESGIDLNYFVGASGFAKPMAEMPGKGPTWITALVPLESDDGGEQLLASYVKVQPPLKVYQRGLARFDDRSEQFKRIGGFDMAEPLYPAGHSFRHTDSGTDYLYFGNPFPVVRVPATLADLLDPSKYETYTCLKQGSREQTIEMDVGQEGPIFQWKPDTIPYTAKLEARLVRDGKLGRADRLFPFHDEDGRPVLIHSGSVYWNDHRQRWIMIAVQTFGTSLLGEVWYAEAADPVGPWQHAVKIVTHDRYSFYNPKQHPMFDQRGGRVVFFEGTYTTMFSGNDDPTPRYNYNQVMYRLDLSDPRLGLPAVER